MLSFLPKFLFRNLTDITPEFLHSKGIDLLLMDFDNTMLPYTTDEPEQPLLDWNAGMNTTGVQLCIVSNSKRRRVPDFSEKYGVDCVTRAKKPFTKGIREALRRYDASKSETALVGDFPSDLLEALVDSVHEDGPAVLRAEDHVVAAGENYVALALVLHDIDIIQY